MKPVFCLGDICADLILPFGAVKRASRGEQVGLTETDVQFRHGGSTANTAAGLATLGIPVQFCGTCGDDTYGHALIEELNQLGIDTVPIRRDPSVPTLLVAIVVDEDGERTAFATHRVHASQHQIHPDQLPEHLVDQISWLHCGGVLLREEPAASVQLEAMRRCYESGIPVSLDIMARIESRDDPVFYHNLLTAAQYCTVLFGSMVDEIPLLSGGTDDASIRVLTQGGKIIVARAGQRGAVVYTETETFSCPAFPVRVVDTVGAGDTYNAGFLSALLRGKSLSEANRIANAAAACCVMHTGGRACPDEAQLAAFLQAQPRF